MGALTPGTVLGGCRIDAVVGRGGMGIVYRARQLDLDRDVAVKVIAPELVEDPRSRKRFLTEARAAGAVEHPNVIPVHGAGVAEGRAYLVMRYVAGDDLRTLVRRDGLPELDRAAAIAAQLGDALDAIHGAGYVHRDVKPQNVMVGADGHVYLSDFGLAKHAMATGGPTTSEQWVGTLDYVAPEQIRGERVDARADVYGLGGVVYFLLTGRVPFERASDHAKLWAHLVDPPPRPSAGRPGLPTGLDAVVARAMAKDPARRYPSAGDLGRAARAAATGERDTLPERMVAVGDAAPGTSGTTALSSGTAGEAAHETTSPARDAVAVAAAAHGTTPPSPRTVGAGDAAHGTTSPSPVSDARRRRRLLAPAALAVAAVAALAFWLGSERGREGEGSAARTTPTPAPRPAASPDLPRVGATIRDVGVRPRALAHAGGALWVLSIHEERIARLDPDTGRRRGVQPFVGRGAASIAGDDDVLWVAKRATSAVLGVDARSGEVIRRIRTAVAPARVAAGPSGLWVVTRATGDSPATLLRYDRAGTQLLEEMPFDDGIAAIVLGGGGAWLALANVQRVMRVEPGRPARHAAWLSHPATVLAYGAGKLWASVEEDDSVARIDRRGQAIITEVGGRPAGIAVAGGHVFVAANTRHRVAVLDPRRMRRGPLRRLRVPANPYALIAAGGHVWVTGVGTNTLTRVDY